MQDFRNTEISPPPREALPDRSAQKSEQGPVGTQAGREGYPAPQNLTPEEQEKYMRELSKKIQQQDASALSEVVKKAYDRSEEDKGTDYIEVTEEVGLDSIPAIDKPDAQSSEEIYQGATDPMAHKVGEVPPEAKTDPKVSTPPLEKVSSDATPAGDAKAKNSHPTRMQKVFSIFRERK